MYDEKNEKRDILSNFANANKGSFDGEGKRLREAELVGVVLGLGLSTDSPAQK